MQQGFDTRIVSYEYIHSVTPEDFAKLIEAIDPHDGEYILDAMCGYGAVGKGVLEKASNANVWFLDESEIQINRAKENVPTMDPSHFIIDSLPHDNFGDEYFDKIAIKMGLHEVSLQQHLAVLKEFHRIIKQAGKIIVWDIMLNDESQSLFQDVIRKKDELAGFDLLVKERYFFREEEFIRNAQNAGFKTITDFHKITSNYSSKRRLESELKGDVTKLEELNNFIRTRFTLELKAKLEFKDLGDDVTFKIPKKIFILQK